eukprot:CAMPEP_0194447608 /NCGR_PEP_ID=MMETSP0176-20130528/129105_1 /TAXON_ID=216777 /ORGANISM="Proboscia alata, Strain PI-D3" /LENGTH=72 /DNA_ID=CAMNT_0039274483 /DNA_START=567 /DNA_END=785 /DNA_ORIENTATION=-
MGNGWLNCSVLTYHDSALLGSVLMACSNVVVNVEAASVVVLVVVGFGAEFVGRRLWVVHLDPDGNGWTKDDV